MCIALPMEVKSIDLKNNTALCESLGVRQEVAIHMCPNLQVTDFILVHAGYALEILDKEEAEKTILMFKEMSEAIL